MKKIAFLMIIGVFLLSGSTKAQSPVSFIMNLSPMSYLYSFDMNGFRVTNANTMLTMYDKIEGNGSLTPFINLGLSINTSIVFIDFSGGGGYFYNGAFNGPTYKGDIAVRFRPGNVFTVGVHGGPVFGNFTWNPSGGYSDDNDVSLSNMFGYAFGPIFTVGKAANFVFSLDYMIGKVDVSTYNGWHANRSQIDMSGLMFNFGFFLRVPYSEKN